MQCNLLLIKVSAKCFAMNVHAVCLKKLFLKPNQLHLILTYNNSLWRVLQRP